MSIIKRWAKPALILLSSFLIGWFLPSGPIDPWNLFSLKKAAYMVFALAFIQALGSAMIQLLGHRKGAIMTGFFGGLISSTATTVALAKDSQESPVEDVGKQTLIFLGATIAMLFEGAALLMLGTSEVHFSLLLVFLGPASAAAMMIVMLHRQLPHKEVKAENIEIEILPILKLSAFIIAVLAVSGLLQRIFGRGGLLILTFLVSLFEIHGSVIANIQLHDSGAFGVQFLGGLFAISVAASYVSKLFLIFTIGSEPLRAQVVKYSAALFVSLVLSWSIFQFLL